MVKISRRAEGVRVQEGGNVAAIVWWFGELGRDWELIRFMRGRSNQGISINTKDTAQAR